MKQRHFEPECSPDEVEESLCRALLSMTTVAEMRALLRDLCTPAEIEAITDRWSVVPHILNGLPYREIYERTAVSITTIGRVARFLKSGNGGYLEAAARANKPIASKRNRTQISGKSS